jgi:hypothetical protein
MSEKQCFKDQNYNEEMVLEWIEHFKNDTELLEIMEKLKQVGETVFSNDPEIEHFSCEYLPEGLNEETYIKIYRK